MTAEEKSDGSASLHMPPTINASILTSVPVLRADILWLERSWYLREIKKLQYLQEKESCPTLRQEKGARGGGARSGVGSRPLPLPPAHPPILYPSPSSASLPPFLPLLPPLPLHRPRAGWPRPRLLTWRWRRNSRLGPSPQAATEAAKKEKAVAVWTPGPRFRGQGEGKGRREGGPGRAGPGRAGGRSRHCGTDRDSGGGTGGGGGGTTQTRTLIGQLPSAPTPPPPHATTPIGLPAPNVLPPSSRAHQWTIGCPNSIPPSASSRRTLVSPKTGVPFAPSRVLPTVRVEAEEARRALGEPGVASTRGALATQAGGSRMELTSAPEPGPCPLGRGQSPPAVVAGLFLCSARPLPPTGPFVDLARGTREEGATQALGGPAPILVGDGMLPSGLLSPVGRRRQGPGLWGSLGDRYGRDMGPTLGKPWPDEKA
ncbi:uncharacterized protein [Notamacropus eugenii]|uniref:uncharacterized protein n=1 Tax=Notamacropus eugenii TaxID=9315 RepID=UPI003B67E091